MTQKTRATLKTQTDATIYDNNVRAITAANHNTLLNDIIDSVEESGAGKTKATLKTQADATVYTNGAGLVNAVDHNTLLQDLLEATKLIGE